VKSSALAKNSESAASDKTVQDLTAKLAKKEDEVKTKTTEAKKAQEKVNDLQGQLDKLTAEAKENKEKLERLEQDAEAQKAKQTPGKTGTAFGGLRKVDDSKTTAAEREKEKQKLNDDMSKMKKERDDLEKSCKEKGKLIEKLQAEIDGLKAQVRQANENGDADLKSSSFYLKKSPQQD
jgi:peptidoglycan hydrolase CwlO-like protein